jgi:hypothetical protein
MVDFSKFREVKYSPLEAPVEYSKEFYLNELQRISRVLDIITFGYLPETNVAPDKPRNGDMRYGDGTNWDPGFGRGIYYFDGDIPAWVVVEGTKKTSSKTADYTITPADDVLLVDASSGNVTVTLPTAVGLDGKRFHIKKTDSSGYTVTIDGNGSETIDGSTTQTILLQHISLTVVSDNANWHII